MLQATGTLTAWKDHKGYGYIAENEGSKKYFVHVSAFGQLPRRPRIGDRIDFHIVSAADGKHRAVNARIAGLPPALAAKRAAPPPARPDRPGAPHRSPPPRRRRTAFGIGLLAVPLTIAAGAFAYGALQSNETPVPDPTPARATSEPAAAPQFRCTGKTRCSEMTSCDEARFYLSHCPDTKMDGDGDGNPCESQWCGR